MQQVFIGYDPREIPAFAVARQSLYNHTGHRAKGISLADMRKKGWYSRETTTKDGVLWDVISDAPMSTEFAISRFLTPHLATTGLALFMDCDMLVRAPIYPLFEMASMRPDIAVWCVKHQYDVPEGVKMDAQVQTRYARKNWSSVMMFNVDHPSNERLTIDLINTVPGRDLHRFCWLDDSEIGELDVKWNYLVGHSVCDDPAIVHHTLGSPFMPGYENTEYADEWRAVLAQWVR